MQIYSDLNEHTKEELVEICEQLQEELKIANIKIHNQNVKKESPENPYRHKTQKLQFYKFVHKDKEWGPYGAKKVIIEFLLDLNPDEWELVLPLLKKCDFGERRYFILKSDLHKLNTLVEKFKLKKEF
ncbi:hypothetical protein [Fundidesulfovibrio putealis]|uniref:hypothetical protein n=1 Tax=Fundidesulfovibrio putealis TaxID=270496 RepID=UPI000485A8CE|nr:hypothetical protein [Fundidesulfovibrio putealis]